MTTCMTCKNRPNPELFYMTRLGLQEWIITITTKQQRCSQHKYDDVIDDMNPNDILGVNENINHQEDNPTKILPLKIQEENKIEEENIADNKVEDIQGNNDHNNLYDENANDPEDQNEMDEMDDSSEDLTREYDEELFDYDHLPGSQKTREGCTKRAPDWLNLFTQAHEVTEYSDSTAMVIAKTINNLNNMIHQEKLKNEFAFLEMFSLNKGLRILLKKDTMQNLVKLNNILSLNHFILMNSHNKNVIMLNFLVEKQDGRAA
jgi:hypothetical protein